MGNSASLGKYCSEDGKPSCPKAKPRSDTCTGKGSPKGQCKQVPVLPRDRVGIWGTGDNATPGALSGLERLRNPQFNKGMAYTIEERQALGIHGLLPPVVKTQEQQIDHSKQCLDRLDDNLNKYLFLMGLLDRNEKLFYALMKKYTKDLMPVVYTPVVGLACQKFGLVYRRPRGLFITIHDKGHVYDVLKNWPENDVRAIVVTDGERILGLGDLGACGMGIPVGKLSLYTALAGVKPQQCLPITLDVGTNTQSMLDDPLYIGLRQNRVRGQEYDDFLDEFMDSVVRRWGQNTLIQFEDFGNHNAFKLLQKYRNGYCTFNDDIQGTASVALAGVIASLKLTKKKLSEHLLLFQGAGEANLGIANLCVMMMVSEGLAPEDAKKRIFMVDSKGLIVKGRDGLTPFKEHFAHDRPHIKDLQEIVETLKPSILIGAAAIPGVFNEAILNIMAKNNDRPVIFALSNPTHKAECTAEECYKYTDGRGIFASGSPFPPVTYKGKEYHPGQGNNSYIFPGVSLGVIAVGMRVIPEEVFLKSAQCLAALVTDDDLDKGSLYPPLSTIQDVSIKMATIIANYAYEIGQASVLPKPTDMEQFIRMQMYETEYEPALPCVYSYPS